MAKNLFVTTDTTTESNTHAILSFTRSSHSPSPRKYSIDMLKASFPKCELYVILLMK